MSAQAAARSCGARRDVDASIRSRLPSRNGRTCTVELKLDRYNAELRSAYHTSHKGRPLHRHLSRASLGQLHLSSVVKRKAEISADSYFKAMRIRVIILAAACLFISVATSAIAAHAKPTDHRMPFGGGHAFYHPPRYHEYQLNDVKVVASFDERAGTVFGDVTNTVTTIHPATTFV